MTDRSQMTEPGDDFLLFCKDDAARAVLERWCGVVVQKGASDGEVMDVIFMATETELRQWFAGWLAGWRSRIFHQDRPSVRERELRA